MPRFQIIPTDQSYSPAELIAPDAGATLIMIDRLECREADVLRDGEYSFSARINANGTWRIFQREEAGPSLLISSHAPA